MSIEPGPDEIHRKRGHRGLFERFSFENALRNLNEQGLLGFGVEVMGRQRLAKGP